LDIVVPAILAVVCEGSAERIKSRKISSSASSALQSSTDNVFNGPAPIRIKSMPASLRNAVQRSSRFWGVWYAAEHNWHAAGGRRHENPRASKKVSWVSELRAHHAVFGPYIYLPTGQHYRAWFRLSLRPREGSDQSRADVVLLDVSVSGTSIAEQWLATTDAPNAAYNLHCVPFYLDHKGLVELRVMHATGEWGVETDYTAITD